MKVIGSIPFRQERCERVLWERILPSIGVDLDEPVFLLCVLGDINRMGIVLQLGIDRLEFCEKERMLD